MPKWVVGIGAYSHDASVAILRDGELVYTAEEERFNRTKHSDAFPASALREGLAFLKIEPADIAEFAYFYFPLNEVTGNLSHLIRYFPQSLTLFRQGAAKRQGGYLSRLRDHFFVGTEIAKTLGLKEAPKVKFIRHHLCHAASAFYGSPFAEAAILTIDGRGEDTTTGFFYGEGSKIQTLSQVKVPHSLGHLYAALTEFLGFRAFFDEWKVMGMAAYGKPVQLAAMKNLVRLSPGGFSLNLDYFSFHTYGQTRWLSDKFYQSFGLPRHPDTPLEQRHFDIAFALQDLVETCALHLCQELYRKTQAKNLCLAGGVAFNVLMNRRILLDSPFEKVFIQPLAGDAGCSYGAALVAHHRESLKRVPFSSPFLGLEYGSDQIEIALREKSLSFEKPQDLLQKAAHALAEGKIIGWFQGRFEAGPRALGHRSILAHPGIAAMKDTLNRRIKRRESFRPFAPSVLKEKCGEFFVLPKGVDSPYMIVAAKVRDEKKSLIPAVTHEDGSARVHTVDRALNPKFYALIEAFEEITALPLLLNTSFNENEPIVATPDQAVDCFLRSQMDILVIGDYWVTG